jgi:predicted transcriptional regulator
LRLTAPRMPDTRSISIRIPAELADRVEQLARERGVSRASILREALEAYCDQQDAVTEQIRAGLRDLNEGRFVSHDRVSRWLCKLADGSVTLRPRPRRR